MPSRPRCLPALGLNCLGLCAIVSQHHFQRQVPHSMRGSQTPGCLPRGRRLRQHPTLLKTRRPCFRPPGLPRGFVVGWRGVVNWSWIGREEGQDASRIASSNDVLDWSLDWSWIGRGLVVRSSSRQIRDAIRDGISEAIRAQSVTNPCT